MTELHHTQAEVQRAHECFKLVIENSPLVAVFGFDRQGRLTQWNREAERVFGIARHTDAPPAGVLLQAAQPADQVDSALTAVWKTGEPTPPLELVLWRGDNECWLLTTLIPVAGPHGVAEVFCMAVDITNRKRSESLLLQKSAELEAVFKALPDLYFRFDAEGTLLDYQTGTQSSLFVPGASTEGGSDSLLGQNVQDVLPPAIGRRSRAAIRHVLRTKSVVSVEYSFLSNGRQQFFEGRYLPLSEDQVIAVIRDITERKQAEERLRHLSIHDSLTGLYNRSYFNEELHRIARSRYKSVGLILCDVDGLKLVNDTLGHAAGDRLLRAAAEVLRGSFRGNDVLSRIGGDEFAVLLPNVTETIVQKACRKIASAIDLRNESHSEVPLSLSVGFAVSNAPPFDMNDLFRRADNEMYREKLHRGQSARSAIMQTLKKALEARGCVAEGHYDRLQQLVTMLVKSLGLPERTRTDLRLLVQFHDIGKVGLSDRILHKEGPLDAEEFAEMRRHSEIGHRIAMSAPDLAPIADWILKHHEWWNGQGYPLGLSGEEIPLACRILAIADAYDTMTNGRPYRKTMSRKEAVKELKRCAGTQFDPALVKKFLSVLRRIDVRDKA
ncbi:MAG: diguanylate cyclase [Bacillota bacterium]|jgi:diguanylate cyclase (GGDEF)-like protein